MTTETELTREELEAALSIATENRRILAQAVLDWDKAEDAFGVMEKSDRMISLAKEMVK